ncbi:MAG: hypothetical protein ATN35_08970 [Epulopiscium sp. Nele67-Bin004]|nr:MAG: hypothetical protein ATN35_08970 [Epulopiscium sp. Nele67-Bin004]
MQKDYYLDLPTFIHQRKLYMLILLIASLAGTAYAVTIRDNSTLLFTINQYLTTPNIDLQLLEVFKNSILTYTISGFLIFVGGLNRNLLPISIISFFYTTFSYSFTFTCFMLLYGVKGIIIGLLMIGIQGTMIVVTYLELGYQGLKHCIYYQTKGIKHYSEICSKAVIMICLISLLDTIVQPLIRILVSNIL